MKLFFSCFVSLFFIGFLLFMEERNPILLNICLFALNFCSIIILILVSKRNCYKYKKLNSIDYYRTLDFKLIKPIEAGYILKKKNLNYNILMIIILELIEKNILTKKYVSNKVYIKLREGITLDEINMLLEENRNIIKLIFKGTDDNNEYEIAKIIDGFKNNFYLNRYLEIMVKELKRKTNSKYFNLLMYDPYVEKFTLVFWCQALSIVFSLPLIAMICCAEMTTSIIIMICLYLLNIFILCFYFFKKIINEKYLLEVSKLKGLYNFIDNFSNIENLDINYIEIYDKYYLYALGFGLTDKIEKKYNFNSINDEIKLNLKYLFYNEGE